MGATITVRINPSSFLICCWGQCIYMAGKRSKKKQVHLRTPFSAPKPPSPASPSPACDPQETSPCVDQGSPAPVSAPSSMMGGCGKMCRHLERGVNIDKLSSQLSKSKFSLTQCQDCVKDGKAGVGKKSKGRSTRKKAAAETATVHSFSHQEKKWVCLACGHVACGALLAHQSKKPADDENDNIAENGKEDDNGAPTGHAWKHSLFAKHPLALQAGDNLVCWCFMCNMAVEYTFPSASLCDVDGNRQVASSSSALQEAVKVVHEKLVKETGFFKDPGKRGYTIDPVRRVIDAASHSNSSDALNPSSPKSTHCTESQRKRTVRGLMNLGNTCFFNSVMQNLLALDMLRDYFSQELRDGEGPLTSSLRRLYLETNFDGGGQVSMAPPETSGHESGLKRGGKGRSVWESSGIVCNPRSLFGAICAKAPRFKGFQQQDSHELLRCLLEGLNSEERNAKAKATTDGEYKKVVSVSANRVLIQNGEGGESERPEEEREHGNTEKPTLLTRTATTFVESFFGGQLCSTVRCCECGHSSVVYEPMLDLSLQIPTRQSLKKGQACANQGTSSSVEGRSQKGSLHRDVKHIKAGQKTGSRETPHALGPAVVQNMKVSSLVCSSAQADQIDSLSAAKEVSSSKIAPIDNSDANDFGWLDFVAGGEQSAEGSLQESCDVQNSALISENNLFVGVEDCISGNALTTVLQPSTLDNSTSLHPSKPVVKVHRNASVDVVPAAGLQNSKLSLESSGTDVYEIPQDKEGEKALVQSEEEDGPLPLASGILLLPYEHLDVPGDPRGEESSKSRKEAAKCSLDISTSLLEEEGDCLDGFSQLFEGDESFPEINQSGGNMEGYNVTEESSLGDGSWEADTAAFDGGEVAVGPPRSVEYEDAILPMSLEGCLADFTKSELLCGENAWECESCSRHIKEKMISSILDTVGKNTEHCLSTKDMVGGGDLGKGLTEQPVGKDVASSTVHSTGSLCHSDWGKCHAVSCTGNGGIYQAFPDLKDGEALSGISNGIMEHNFSVSAFGDHKVEQICNGSAKLNKPEGGQLCGNRSPLCQVDNEMSTLIDGGNITERLADMPKGVRDNEVGSGELGTQDSTGSAQSLQTDRSIIIHTSVKKEGQVDCTSLGRICPETLSSLSKDKLVGPVGKSSKTEKCKSKNRQQPEKLVKRDATKKLSISKAPPILTVHLKRFAQDIRGRLNKLSGHVTFPEVLDLRPFLDPRCLDLDNCVYQLVGVVEHGGTMRGGHYVAYVRGPCVEEASESTDHGNKDFWYYVSDSSVRKATLQAVLNSEAYLLFYERCKVKEES